ncbi:TPA: FeoB-associated Cys-rich membrane protein [Klebsiella pneumoniae]|nr:FeoB-associated Cys-rich membrane protein [Klebsiella pneumoniae]
MENLIVLLTVVVIVGLSAYKIITDRRKGNKCCGCPQGNTCASNKSKQ